MRSRDQTNLKQSAFFFTFLCLKYHYSKLCLAGCSLQKESNSAIRFSDISGTGSVASRAWEQTLLPDAVPVCSWIDIKVLATRQAGVFMRAEQPYHCCNGHPDLDCLLWVRIKGKAVRASVCVYFQINTTCRNNLSS